MQSDYILRQVRWEDHAPLLTEFRKQVFCAEQGVPEAIEIDGIDPQCVHMAAFCGDRVVGTGRLLPSGKIGRMAVAADWRRRGVGRALLDGLLAEARRRGFDQVSLAAQVEAVGFYAASGFQVVSGVYMEAGIPHQDMRLRWGTMGVDAHSPL